MIEPVELTIYDWVKVDQTTETVTARVLGVHKDGVINYEVDYSGIRATNQIHSDYVSPIELTEDILEKNRFTKDGNGDYGINDDIVVVMDWKGKSEHFACAPYEFENCFGQHYLYVELFECKYVHQLQHLLRMAGVQKGIEL